MMVRSSLAAMAEEQVKFFKRIDERLSTFTTAINERLHATDLLLIGRFDGVDERLDEQNERLAAMNQILTGVRHATDSALDVATTAAREIREVRRSSIPDHAPAPALKAVTGSTNDEPG